MTDEDRDWRAADDPVAMLTALERRPGGLPPRKLNLFAAGCCRRLAAIISEWGTGNHLLATAGALEANDENDAHFAGLSAMAEWGHRTAARLDDEGQSAMSRPRSPERALAAKLAYAKLRRQTNAALTVEAAANMVAEATANRDVAGLVRAVAWTAYWERFPETSDAVRQAELRNLAGLVRCVFGNPFTTLWGRQIDCNSCRGLHGACRHCNGWGFFWNTPSWLTEAARRLARASYDDGDFGRLPVLADAIEEAGCDQPDVVEHLRGGGPHGKGCWVLDAIIRGQGDK